MIEISSSWKLAYPGASIGVLVMHGVTNPQQHSQLDGKKKDLEDMLRIQFSSYDRTSLREFPVLASYRDY